GVRPGHLPHEVRHQHRSHLRLWHDLPERAVPLSHPFSPKRPTMKTSMRLSIAVSVCALFAFSCNCHVAPSSGTGGGSAGGEAGGSTAGGATGGGDAGGSAGGVAGGSAAGGSAGGVA